MAVASFTRLRPSRMPARRNMVRRCCFTVRGLIFSWLAISLLLQPCTRSFSTCASRGVILICPRSLTAPPQIAFSSRRLAPHLVLFVFLFVFLLAAGHRPHHSNSFAKPSPASDAGRDPLDCAH